MTDQVHALVNQPLTTLTGGACVAGSPVVYSLSSGGAAPRSEDPGTPAPTPDPDNIGTTTMAKKTQTTKTPRARKTAPKAAPKAPEQQEHPRVLKGTVVPVKYKVAYAAHDGTCGDNMALYLKDKTTKLDHTGKVHVLDVDALWAIARENGIDGEAKYGHVNNGQKRMNIGNLLRGLIRNGVTVSIQGKRFAKLVKAEDAPAPTPAPKAKGRKAKEAATA